jgi:hypothetical protein
LIKIENEPYDAKCTIKDPFGNIVEGTLRGFIEQVIIRPLHAAVLFKGEYGSYDAAFDALKRGDITSNKIEEKLRTPYFSTPVVVCIRKHSCNYKCKTAEEAVERHLREIAGIFGIYRAWRYLREDSAREYLGKNLSPGVKYAMFVGFTSLFLGSTMLDEELKSEENKELAYREIEFFLVQPMEFLSLSDMILNVYTSVYRNKFREIKGRRRRGETVKPSEIEEIREGLMDGLEEYNNVSLFIKDPNRRIMEYGKERLRLSDRVDTLKSLLKELDDMARTLYEEETLKKQEEFSRAQVELAARQKDLSVMQVILAALFGLFGIFQALEFLEPRLGILKAIAITSAIFLPYPIYKLISYLYRKRGRKT